MDAAGKDRAGARRRDAPESDASRESPGCTRCGEQRLNVVMGAERVCVWCLKDFIRQEEAMKVPAKKEFDGTDGYGKPYDKNVPPPPPHPAGTANAVIVDYIDMGMCERDVYNGNGKKETVHLCKYVVQSVKTMPDGRRYLLAWRPFGVLVSLDPKAALRQFLESVEGRAFEVDEDIEFESFVGRPCVIIVSHKVSADGTKVYANISSAGPHMEGLPVLTPEGYIRLKDRTQAAPADDPANDADIPF